MQVLIALGGMFLLLAVAAGALFGIAWAALLLARHLPLIGRRGRFDQKELKEEWHLPKAARPLPLPKPRE